MTTKPDSISDRRSAARQTPTRAVEHFDVLIVGAGISGIGAAYHLSHEMPDRSLVVLESRADFGGTWDINRFPGVRSDSDMFTFGYSFKPWMKNELATGEEILKYLSEVIEENDLDRLIRYKHRVTRAEWSTDLRCWAVEVLRTDSGEVVTYTANFLWMCQGYYRQDAGYTPNWPGMDSFAGPIVHPLTWPEDLDYRGKRVVVIGSGATAATIVPTMAGDGAAHVTMLQRSPSYYASKPLRNEMAETLRSVDTPPEWTHEIMRRLIFQQGQQMTKEREKDPKAAADRLIELVRAELPEGFDVDKHFTPSYPVWRQRLCLIPEWDLFRAIRDGKASVVTDVVDRFTPGGVMTGSGDLLEADIVVTATGFDLRVMGDIPFLVDGEPVEWASTVTYHGIMFTGVPNLAYVFGYFRASWTLRVDLIADLVCRLLARMDEVGATMVTPALRDTDVGMPLRPWIDPDDFNPGYVMRTIHKVPRQGDRLPWRGADVGFHEEREVLPRSDLDDGSLIYK